MQYKVIYMMFLTILLVACKHGSNTTADDKYLEVQEGSSVDFTLTGTASNGSELTYQVVSGVPADAGVLYLTPQGDGRFEANPDFYGTAQFTFTVNDGRWISAPATVTIRVKSIPDLASARYKNGSASDTSVPWTSLEINLDQGKAVVISADGITNLDRAFELIAEHENGDEVSFSVVEEGLPAGISFNPDGTGTINTGITGTGHFSFHVLIHGKNGTSDPIPVNISTSYLITDPTVWISYQIDALNRVPLEWTRFRLGAAENRAVFALTLINTSDADWGITKDLEFTVHFGEIDAAEPHKVVLSAYAPSETAVSGPYISPPVLDNVPGDSTLTLTQAGWQGETVYLVVENQGAAEEFAFDLSVIPEVKQTIRGELYEKFGSITDIPMTSIDFSALSSEAEETATGIDIICNDFKCELNKSETGETGFCGYEAERGVGSPECVFLDNAGAVSSTCSEQPIFDNFIVTSYFYSCAPYSELSDLDSTFQLTEPVVIPTDSSSIAVTVPDGGGYAGGDATYEGSIITPTSSALIESALTGSVSQLYIATFLSEFQAYINNDASADPAVASYFNYILGLNLTPGDTLTRLLEDLTEENGSNNENAAIVLTAFMPKWILELARHPREALTGDEIAIIATAMHHINVRREQLIVTAESHLEAYRESQLGCLTVTCLFEMEGFPSVIEQTVADVDTAWIGGLAGVVAGTASGVALVAVVTTATASTSTTVFLLPHAGAVTMAGGALGSLAALPVTVIVIAVASTYMAVNNLFIAEENEQAYNTFINENSVLFTSVDDFINQEYIIEAHSKLISEIVIAGQKMLLEAFL